ncbi:hypothetical protein [uncultured Sphaerochaeta sp.]|uniref:hypothetical protein n=1 Tax=uncultured Sphaerochaeta sp. TaxID=886478 RepID=UPI002A0A9B41|nr:hypothetical protein [uncultured Sphaerochaeta sp.]
MSKIITLEEYKDLTGITDNKIDAQINALILVVEDDYLSIRNKPFDTDANGDIIYPAGSKMAAAEMISYKILTLRGNVGSTYEMIGGYSISLSADLIKGYPKSTVQKIRRYGRLS